MKANAVLSKVEKVGTASLRDWWRTAPPGRLTSEHAGDIVCSDALECLASLRDEVAGIVFLDPPFNLGKSYGSAGARGDRLSEDKYEAFLTKVIEHSVRILKPGGSIYLYHIPRWGVRLSPILGSALTFRHWIAVSMKNGFVRRSGLYPAHYALLHYTKGTAAVINRPKIAPATCPHCDEYIRDYGGYAKHVENGVNLSDVWDDLSPVRHKKYKHRNANELPLAIPRRVVDISGRRGELLVDPFAGTGTSVIAARLKKMKFIAADRETENCTLISDRLRAISARKKKTGAT
jgi:site-specific DNA-methyltransferase (adenine-specific)